MVGGSREGSRSNTRRRDLSSSVLSFLALLAIMCFLAPTAADADLWGHLTFGRDIVNHRKVDTSDPYSFTSDRPWINHEWLAEVLMWTSYSVGGATGLVALKLLVACTVLVLVLSIWRRHSLPPQWRDGLLFTTAVGLWPIFATIRPQIFSLLLLAALLALLERLREGQRKVLWVLPLLFMAWVNVHGGWIVGAGVLAVFVVGSFFDRRCDGRTRLALIVAAVASGTATLVNPYGPQMLAFVTNTVRPDRTDIVEWQSLTRLPTTVLVLWCVPTVTAAAAVWRRHRTIPVSSLMITVMLGLGSFRVARLLSFYALAVAMLLAPYVRSEAAAETTRWRNRRIWYSAASYLLTLSVALSLFGRHITMQGPWLPEPDVAIFVKTQALAGRMLTWFDYGHYAIWHFSPRIRVSMDGRRETLYSDDVRALHWRIYRNEPTALKDLALLAPDYVWLPVDFPIVARLEAAGWHQVFRGPRSTLLARDCVDCTPAVAAAQRPSDFPGP